MRTISSALQSAQEATSGTPFIGLIFVNPAGGYENYSDRVKLIEYHEEPYNDWAIILLGNSDREVVDLTGYHIQILLGHDGDGVQYARLWVKSQAEISMEGKLVVAVTLEGVWSLMGEQLVRIGTPPLYNDQPFITQTVYSILRSLLVTELSAATGFNFSLNSLGDQDDGIINTFIPQFSPNQVAFDDFNTLVQTLMAMTHCYLRIRPMVFEIVFPQEGDDVDETYYSDRAHVFFEYVEQRNIIVPNHIIVFCNQQEEGWVAEALITGEAQDDTQISKYMEVIGLFTAPTITNQTDATNRALAIKGKLQAEITSGRLVIPHDCKVELYDRVEVYDAR